MPAVNRGHQNSPVWTRGLWYVCEAENGAVHEGLVCAQHHVSWYLAISRPHLARPLARYPYILHKARLGGSEPVHEPVHGSRRAVLGGYPGTRQATTLFQGGCSTKRSNRCVVICTAGFCTSPEQHTEGSKDKMISNREGMTSRDTAIGGGADQDTALRVEPRDVCQTTSMGPPIHKARLLLKLRKGR
jgi:hypothetical protein